VLGGVVDDPREEEVLVWGAAAGPPWGWVKLLNFLKKSYIEEIIWTLTTTRRTRNSLF
jgi:hypothetical protein